MESAIAVLDTDQESDDHTAIRDTRVEHLLDEWKLPYELDQQFSLSRVTIDPNTQIRNEVRRAPKSTVEQYVVHMRHGAIFPPLVVTSAGQLVDGNTRLAACKELKRKTFPVYKVKFPHLPIAKMMAAALNQLGGDRLSEDEIVIAAEAMMAQGYGDEAIARTLGRSVNHVRNVRKDRVFREAAERTGLGGAIKLPKATQRILASIQHDEPFKAAVSLVQRTNPSMKDTTALVQRIDKTRSDAEALSTIQAVEAQWGPVAGPPPERQSLSRTHAKKALVHAKALLVLGEDPAKLVLPDHGDSLQTWEQLNALATKVVAAYTISKSH